MNRRAAVFVAVMVALTILNFLWPTPPSPLTSSSFGKTGSGHGAVYDLLSESGLSRGRSFESGRRLADDGTLWWIDPVGVCDGRIARGGEADVLDAADVQWPVAEWLHAGGVGVVFLQSADPGGPVQGPQEQLVVCDAIGGVAMPRRQRLSREGGEGKDEGQRGASSSGARMRVDDTREPASSSSWELAQGKAYGFEESLDWEVVARIRAPAEDPLPFVLARVFGDGTLVVVADSGFTHNAWLDRADAAPLVVELVDAYGLPRFDEREHGFLPETSAFRYIMRSAALPVFLGLALLGLLYAWRGNALPPRSVTEFDPAAPTLDAYVASMAALYAGTRDHTRVLARYRELTASRLKRHFGLPQEVSQRALAERIEGASHGREGRAGSNAEVVARRRERIAALVEDRPAATFGELEVAARELDALVTEVTR